MSSIVPAPFKQNRFSPSQCLIQQNRRVAHNGAIFAAAAAYSVYILSASSGSELNSACAIIFFSCTAFSMCFFNSSDRAIRYPQPAASHLIS